MQMFKKVLLNIITGRLYDGWVTSVSEAFSGHVYSSLDEKH